MLVLNKKIPLALLFSFLLLVTLSCRKENASLIVVNLSSQPIDSIKIKLLFAKDTSTFHDVIASGHKKTLKLDVTSQKIPPSAEGVNFFKYYIDGQEVAGHWGLIDGQLSVQASTLYIFDKGWSSTPDSTQLCCESH